MGHRHQPGGAGKRGLWGREERRGDRKSWAGGSLGTGGAEVRLAGRQTGEALKWGRAAAGQDCQQEPRVLIARLLNFTHIDQVIALSRVSHELCVQMCPLLPPSFFPSAQHRAPNTQRVCDRVFVHM